MFPVTEDEVQDCLMKVVVDNQAKDVEFMGIGYGVKRFGLNLYGKYFINLSDDELSWSLNYVLFHESE